MKNVIIFSIFGLVFLFSCNKEDNNQNVNQLTESEKQGLLFTRQEEKLAYDVYRYAYQKYGSNIFNNISNSELTHQNTIDGLLDKYNLDNPVKNMAQGQFENDDLQLLYLQLIQKVDISLTDAFEAGATIEDLDINDLMILTTETNKTDLISVYEMLTCGSRNHIRGFTDQLSNLGKTYEPQFLDQTVYDTILKGSHESCRR